MDVALLDSHTLIWACSQPERLSPRVRDWLEESHHRALVSHATLWELSIKVTVGKLDLPESFFIGLPDLGYEWLEINPDHMTAYRSLPLLHRDPFDRMLVAQAQHEAIPLLSCDPDLRAYPVEVVW